MGRVLLLLCLLAACSQPSPAFRGIAPVRVTVGDSVFDVLTRQEMRQELFAPNQ
jgi:hypothetical protein